MSIKVNKELMEQAWSSALCILLLILISFQSISGQHAPLIVYAQQTTSDAANIHQSQSEQRNPFHLINFIESSTNEIAIDEQTFWISPIFSTLHGASSASNPILSRSALKINYYNPYKLFILYHCWKAHLFS